MLALPSIIILTSLNRFVKQYLFIKSTSFDVPIKPSVCHILKNLVYLFYYVKKMHKRLSGLCMWTCMSVCLCVYVHLVHAKRAATALYLPLMCASIHVNSWKSPVKSDELSPGYVSSVDNVNLLVHESKHWEAVTKNIYPNVLLGYSRILLQLNQRQGKY